MRRSGSLHLFLSTLSLRRATNLLILEPSAKIFLSTLSLRRATYSTTLKCPKAYHFYPRSPCGERRPPQINMMGAPVEFLSTLSLRRATYGRINDISRLIFLSTLSLRRATGAPVDKMPSSSISIHALLAESDPLKNAITAVPQQISIHALLAESDRANSSRTCL